jgi:short-subunit dehydrogenase
MKSLFIGGSSQIAEEVAKKIKYVESISKNKCKNYSRIYKIKDYKFNKIKNILKKIKIKYDNVVIFNGAYESSTLSNFSQTEFEKSFFINFKVPLFFATEILNNRSLNKNGCIFFISSIAAETTLLGNAYYSLSKNALNFAANILSDEQKKRGIRVNIISFGAINNSMGKSTISNLKKKKIKLIKKENYVRKMIKILRNKKINKKKIFIK